MRGRSRWPALALLLLVPLALAPPAVAAPEGTLTKPFFRRNGIYAYGSLPEIDELFQRQAREQDREAREALLHQIQRVVADQMLAAPIFQHAFIWGVGPRVAEAGASLIEGYPYAAPCEDLKPK